MHEPVASGPLKELSPRERIARLKLIWRRHTDQLARHEIEPNLRIGVAASFTDNSLYPFIGGPLLEAGVAPTIEHGPFNQLFQVCLDHKSHFHGDPDVIIMLVRLEDIALEELLAFLQGDAGAYQRAAAKIDLLHSTVQTLRNAFKGTLILNLPPYPTSLPATTSDLGSPLGLGSLHRGLTSHFADRMSSITGVRLCDFDAVQRECGWPGSFDARQWYLYRQPFTDLFLLRAGALLSRMIIALRQAPKKCVVLDCDNTLWGGVIGEDGLAGIQLGDEFPGTAFRDFQRLLLYWRQQGVLLALASKNNEADVWEVFDKHSGMLLKREHISAWQINWNPKSENIPQIAKALNIGVDSLVFIDDNPMEIEYMRAARPEVQCVPLPEEAADILASMQSLPWFDRLDVTQEDRKRADMMRAEKERESLSGSLSKEDFRKSLGLRLDFFRAQDEDLDRITQLINKTNQFNLSTIRRSLDEVRLLAASPRHRIFGLRVADKFGEYGLTGVVIAELPEAQPIFFIDTLLLSCRVLGRGVETALLAALADEARAGQAVDLVASFIPSPKNAPAASFLPDHGFVAEEPPRWRLAVSAVPPLCPSIQLQRPQANAAAI